MVLTIRLRTTELLLVTALGCLLPGTVFAASGCVATVHPLATDAGLAALERGGNAVDAAVAAALTLGVVDPSNSGIGGGCFMVLHLADGTFATIDGREIAGAKATPDMYVRNGQVQPRLAQKGPLAVGVPGAIAAYDSAVRQFGRLTLADLLLPAAQLAERGFPVDAGYAGRFRSAAKDFALDAGCRQVFLDADGSPLQEGDRLKQADLASTYRAIAKDGVDWFYRGPLARQVDTWMAANGGILTADDFAAYRPRQREPVVGTYRGLTVISMPPPSSGGVHVLQILNILEQFDLKAIHQRDPARFYHVVAEAMKLAFADRAHWLGDPDFTRVPTGLVDKGYATELASQIQLDKPAEVAGHGEPPDAGTNFFGKHTTHVAAADSEGNWVALTATINTSFGASVMVPGTGVLLNNQMDDFSAAPGTPNAFGLVGSDANAIAPFKRPLSSMSPTIVLKDGRPVFTVGAAGGPRIITQAVLAIVNHLDLGMTPADALAAKRIHHQWRPNTLYVEKGFDPAIAEQLRALGHRVVESGAGVTQAIARTEDGQWIGVHDPRVHGKAAHR